MNEQSTPSNTEKTKILVIRPDRLGDLVLSTPVFEALKRHYRDGQVYALVRDVAVPVVEHNPHLAGVVAYGPDSVHSGFFGFWRLVRELRTYRFDIAITLQVGFTVTLAMLLAGIRCRIGPYSKWYSFFAFNRGTRQSRSAVEMHEADYNLALLQRLGIQVSSRKLDPTIVVDAQAKERMHSFLREIKIADGKAFVVVHAGMGGSALNWPERYYSDLVRRLTGQGVRVILSGGFHEKSLLERVLRAVKDQQPENLVQTFIGSNSTSGLSDLIALLSMAQVTVAPSTGPLHIAAALGRRTVSFYPPIKVQSPTRWSPYSSDQNKHDVLVPDVLCGQDFKCAGRRCEFYFCMERLSVDEAVQRVLRQLADATGGKHAT